MYNNKTWLTPESLLLNQSYSKQHWIINIAENKLIANENYKKKKKNNTTFHLSSSHLSLLFARYFMHEVAVVQEGVASGDQKKAKK